MCYSHSKNHQGQYIALLYVFTTSEIFLQNCFLHQWSKMFTKITLIYKK